MNNLLELIKDLKPIYVIMLLMGVVGAVIIHFINRKKYDKFYVLTTIYTVSLVLALMLSYSVNKYINIMLIKLYKLDAYQTNFSFLNTLILFVVIIKIFSVIIGFKFSDIKEQFILSVLTFMTFAKLGCLFNGCCASKQIFGIVLHFNLYESIFALTLICLSFFKKIKVYDLFFLIYLPYRFLSEFFRETYQFQKICFGVMTSVQIISLIVFVVEIIVLVLNSKNDVKNK